MAQEPVIIFTEQARREAIATLLDLYARYNRAWFSYQKRRIGERMRFADPIVWMRYKHQAYQGTPSALHTWGDLIEHSFSHDGICGKRLHWLLAQAQKEGVDMLSAKVIDPQVTITEVSQLPIVNHIATSPTAMQQWNEYEYYMVAGVPKKWLTYSVP